MRGLYKSTALVIAVAALTGCSVLDNKWVRVRKQKNPDVAKTRLKMPNFRGPKDRVEQFFLKFHLKDWQGMKGMIMPRSDFQWIADKVLADFERYSSINAEAWPSEPEFNAAQDRAKVNVEFTVEKIVRTSGSLEAVRGRGTFVLSGSSNWEIAGYVGDPFWGEGVR